MEGGRGVGRKTTNKQQTVPKGKSKRCLDLLQLKPFYFKVTKGNQKSSSILQ